MIPGGSTIILETGSSVRVYTWSNVWPPWCVELSTCYTQPKLLKSSQQSNSAAHPLHYQHVYSGRQPRLFDICIKPELPSRKWAPQKTNLSPRTIQVDKYSESQSWMIDCWLRNTWIQKLLVWTAVWHPDISDHSKQSLRHLRGSCFHVPVVGERRALSIHQERIVAEQCHYSWNARFHWADICSVS